MTSATPSGSATDPSSDPVSHAAATQAEAECRALSATGEIPDAATVLLLRDGEEGLEVCVIERKKAGAFAGLLAFPGGKVDATDRGLPGTRWRGTADPDGHAPMDNRDLGWQVAAVREAFEEVGVLLAHRTAGTAPGGTAPRGTAPGDLVPVTAEDLTSRSFLDTRAALSERGVAHDWTAWLDREGLVLDLAALGAWSWWITPPQEPRRFDTRFFVAVVPPEQAEALNHDEVETDSARWMTLAAIDAEHREGRATLIYPTRRNLDLLRPYGSAAEALAAARGGHLDLRPVMPTLVDSEGTLVATHPYDGTVEPVL